LHPIAKETALKDWILVALLILLAAMALGLFGFFGLQTFLWDRAYDHALSKYKDAYAHRDDRGSPNFYVEYDAAERKLENTRIDDPERLQKFKDLHACGLSLKGYRNLKVNGFGTAPFEKAAAACDQ
jgi:hypothetical protein